MPIYNDNKPTGSGVPLGGIGAGKLEILPNGLFTSFTFLNNWGQPISGGEKYPGILGYHMAIYVQAISPDAHKTSGPQAISAAWNAIDMPLPVNGGIMLSASPRQSKPGTISCRPSSNPATAENESERHSAWRSVSASATRWRAARWP